MCDKIIIHFLGQDFQLNVFIMRIRVALAAGYKLCGPTGYGISHVCIFFMTHSICLKKLVC